MPFVSQAQRAKFYSDPNLRPLADEFEAATPKDAELPERVAPKQPKRLVRVQPHMRGAPKRKAKPVAKSMAPGGGGRFAAMVASGKSPALAAYIGRKKYGGAKFAKMSAHGRHRAAQHRALSNLAGN